MARPNVTVIVNDQSFVISGTESGGAHVAGFPSSEGLLFALGNTTETQQGFMRVEGTDDWFGRLKSPEPLSNYGGGSTAGGDLPFYHFTPGSTFSGQRLDPEQVNRDALAINYYLL